MFQAGVVVPVYELLLQEPVGVFDHGVVVRVALARRRSSDVEHVEQPDDFRVVEPATPVRVEHLHLGQGEAERGERGHDQVGGAARVGAVAGDAPVRQAGQQARVRPLAADAHVRQVTGQAGARLVAVELAVDDVREPGLVNPRPVRFGPLARIRTRHALFAHDVADAPPGRGDAPPFQGGLNLPDAVASAAGVPDRAHVAGDRIHPLGFGMPGHPVVGGAGNARYPALR